jgi:hypothetical protein
MACGSEYPSQIGTECVTPSPESRTIPNYKERELISRIMVIPVVRPEEYSERIA